MLTADMFGRLFASLDFCPWGTSAGRHIAPGPLGRSAPSRTARGRLIYSAEERRRRDATPWTTVQAILAPIQFLVFLVSLALVLRYVATGNGWAVATASVVVKTFVLYTIMVTGAIWERKVFGRYLFAPAFFWEDVVSMIVIALHTLYLFVLFTGKADHQQQMTIALAAYGTYLVNAVQYIVKMRAARMEKETWQRASSNNATGFGLSA